MGSVQGSLTVDGNTFVDLSYGYSYSNLWRNYGIIIAFGVAFLAVMFWLSEMERGGAGEAGE